MSDSVLPEYTDDEAAALRAAVLRNCSCVWDGEELKQRCPLCEMLYDPSDADTALFKSLLFVRRIQVKLIQGEFVHPT